MFMLSCTQLTFDLIPDLASTPISFTSHKGTQLAWMATSTQVCIAIIENKPLLLKWTASYY